MVKTKNSHKYEDKLVLIALSLTLLVILVDAWRNPDHTILAAVVVAIALSTSLNRKRD